CSTAAISAGWTRGALARAWRDSGMDSEPFRDVAGERLEDVSDLFGAPAPAEGPGRDAFGERLPQGGTSGHVRPPEQRLAEVVLDLVGPGRGFGRGVDLVDDHARHLERRVVAAPDDLHGVEQVGHAGQSDVARLGDDEDVAGGD